MTARKPFTVAAMGDLHVRETGEPQYRDLFIEIEKSAQALALCGDLTETGSVKEAEHLAHELSSLTIPVVAVFGNHDHDRDQISAIKEALAKVHVIVLEDQTYTVGDVGFAGTKGFGGGFGGHMLAPFGEPALKAFVEEAIKESVQLENGLQRLATPHKIVVLHYAPIPQTVHGESPEIFPFLGSSRLAETIERFEVDAVFHGHAHNGTFEGTLRKGSPVFNCSQDVARKHTGKPYVLFQIPRAAAHK